MMTLLTLRSHWVDLIFSWFLVFCLFDRDKCFVTVNLILIHNTQNDLPKFRFHFFFFPFWMALPILLWRERRKKKFKMYSVTLWINWSTQIQLICIFGKALCRVCSCFFIQIYHRLAVSLKRLQNIIHDILQIFFCEMRAKSK